LPRKLASVFRNNATFADSKGDFRNLEDIFWNQTKILHLAAIKKLISPSVVLGQINNILQETRGKFGRFKRQERALFIIGSLVQFSQDPALKQYFSITLITEFVQPEYVSRVQRRAIWVLSSLAALDENIDLFAESHLLEIFKAAFAEDPIISFNSVDLLLVVGKKLFQIEDALFSRFPEFLHKIKFLIQNFGEDYPFLLVTDIASLSAEKSRPHLNMMINLMEFGADRIHDILKTSKEDDQIHTYLFVAAFRLLSLFWNDIDPYDRCFELFFFIFLLAVQCKRAKADMEAQILLFFDFELRCISYISDGFSFPLCAAEFLNNHITKNYSNYSREKMSEIQSRISVLSQSIKSRFTVFYSVREA